MIGAIAGDIFGSIYEHHPIKTTEFQLLAAGCRFTDDTVLTIAVADAFLNGGDYARVFQSYCFGYPNAGYGGGFHQWAGSHRFDVSCQGTVPHALRAVFEARNFEQAVRLAISLGRGKRGHLQGSVPESRG